MGLADLCVDVVLEFLGYLSLEELLQLRMVCRYLNEVIVVNLLYITTVDKRISNRLLSRVLLEYLSQDRALKAQVTKIRNYMRTYASETDRKKCTTRCCLRAISIALTTYNGRDWVLQNYKTAVIPWIESWNEDKSCITFLLAAWMGLQNIITSALDRGINANTSHPLLGDALFAAAYNNDINLAKELILRGVNRRKREGAFGDAFQLAAYRGSDQFVHTMLMADPGLRHYITLATTPGYGPFGSAFNAAAAAGCNRVRNALFLAARNGRANVVKLLLHSGLIDPNVPDSHGISPLLAAIQEGHEKVVRLLLQISEVKLNDTGRTGNIPTPLVAAASQGKARIVRMLLKRPDIDINRSACDISLFTPDQSRYLLNSAVSHGQTDIVRALLNNSHHIDPHIPDSNGQASLHIAVIKNRTEILRLLLAYSTTDPNLPDKQGSTPLMLATLHNNHEIIHLLIQDNRTRYETSDISGTTLLMHAIIKNNETVFHAALNHTTDYHLNAQNKTGSSALHIACITNTTFALEALLSSTTTINPNLQNTQGLTPLHCAILHKATQAIIWLLQTPTISPQLPDRKGTTPLCLAIEQNNLIATDLLLSHLLVDINHPSSSASSQNHEPEYTPLILTTITNNLPLTLLLLGHPTINPNLPDSNGDTPLAHAAKHGHLAIAEALLAHTATNPHLGAQIGGIVGTPPLVHAAENNHLDMVQFLLQSGRVYPDAPDRYLRTPLIAAAEKGHTEVVRELFRLGGGDVDVEHMDMRRMTALRVAARNGHEGVVRFLVVEIGVRVDLGRRSGVKLVEEVRELRLEGVVRLLESAGGNGSGGEIYEFF
ncbi:serine/threonine-protein phosphatase 6 regulatory ankyrin repeat subunit B [Aspergillus awamori]|uniref:Serine/threonine-protein phosphatase 6 regulatory ankyrin repeat subunit B n=1 Tax=Aspergillus awamori TaxID=105351 RepID=A0A401KI55_ASPAW|nr:serine/threonine-protein phosphatase 6 regulatory ankyrin repeat subunit B [Aspergillus awamori]